MTTEQCLTLSYQIDSSFKWQAEAFGFKCAGPSARGSFLVKEGNGNTWLFGTEAAHKYGRTVVPSVWSELNLNTMGRTA